jgi:hypothetical protein
MCSPSGGTREGKARGAGGGRGRFVGRLVGFVLYRRLAIARSNLALVPKKLVPSILNFLCAPSLLAG